MLGANSPPILLLGINFGGVTLTCLKDTLELRDFRPADQAVVKPLVLAGLVEHWGFLDPTKNPDLDDIANTYASGDFLTAWQQGELVGTGALIPQSVDVGCVVRMSIAPQLRRQGLGFLILDSLCMRAKEKGYRQVVLETTSTWKGVIAFYLRYGFKITGERDGDTYFELTLS